MFGLHVNIAFYYDRVPSGPEARNTTCDLARQNNDLLSDNRVLQVT